MSSIFDNIRGFKDSKKTAIYFKSSEISYSEFYKNVLKLSNYFINLGLKKGDVVTLVLPNTPICVYCIYALNYIGVKISILHYLNRFKTIIDKMEFIGSKNVILLDSYFYNNKDFIKNSDINFIFTNAFKYEGVFKRFCYWLKCGKVNYSKNVFNLDKYTKTRVDNYEFDNLDKNETSFYIHSGGTTDIPKTIELSNNAINNISVNLYEDNINYSDSKVLAVLPVFHCFGLCVGIHMNLNINASIYLMCKFNVEEIIDGINKNKIKMILAIPSMIKKIISHKNFNTCKIENLNECFIGGDSLNNSVVDEFNAIIKGKDTNAVICQGYGLTETSSVIVVNDRNNYKKGSLGKPLSANKILILDENNNKLRTKEIGEICVTGNTLMNGYFNDKKATDDAFIYIDEEKYLKTGDLGYLDRNGFLFYVGRKKRIFKISGVTVYPSEVENIVLSFANIIQEVSLECFTDDKRKPYLVLFIVKKDIDKDEEEIIKLITDKIKENTIKYNWPAKIIVLDNMPKNAAGKIDHSFLLEKYK